METIEPFAISHCDNLRTITIESDIMKEIGLMGFAQSIRFASIVIPESVERIDELAFYDCTQLQSVMIPQNVSQIDSTSFADCFYLESINVDDANEFYTSVDGVLYDKEISTVICCPGNISGNWVLPDSVTAIEPFACFGSVHVTEITLPQSLESIELAAFSNCFALEKINIPSKVTELPEKTFLNCYNLSEIDYQGTVSEIGDYCFCGCGFTSIDGAWPENLNTIVKGAFRANQLRTLEIPSHVTFIEDDAFSNNELLAEVNISEELLSLIDVESVFWNTLYLGFSGEVGNNATYLRKGHKLTISGYGPTFDYTFDPPTGGEEVEEVEIEEGITSLGTRVLACKRYGIESIIIPVSVQQINEDCFDRTWINEITILSPICTIDCELNCQILYGYDQSTAEAYANNHELVTFVSLGEAPHVDPIDDNVKASGSCGENADWNLDNGVLTISGIGETDDWTDWSETPWFEYRDYIKSIIVQEGITKIGNYAFSKCASLNDISLNEGLLRIGECAFLECSKLNAITIPQSVIEIGCAAFSVNSKLSSIVLPDQLTIIADNLFTACSNLSDIVIPESVTSIGEWAFSGCDKLKKITIPENTEIIGQFAFSGSGIESITIPNGVSVIDEYTFFGCRFLSSIIIPQNITHIYRQAFYRCPNLNTIIFEGDMPYISPSEVFGEVTATIYYPGDNETWAGASLDTYNGNIEWKPYYSDEETKIVSHPTDVQAKSGEQVSLHVEAEGKNLRYQWQWSTDGERWKNCTSAGYNTDTFSFVMKDTLNGRHYRCVVTSGDEQVISQAALITFVSEEELEITSQPQNVTVGIGEIVSVHIEVNNADAAYQWQWSSDGTTWKNCMSAGYNTDTFSFNMKASLSGRQYRCKVTCERETLVSDAATITLSVRPEIISQPADVEVEVGETVMFTVGVQGEDPAYQWQWSADGTTWKNCTSGGYNTENFSFVMKATLSGRQYRCKVTCGGKALISDAATITLINAVEIISQPADVSATVGEAVTLAVGVQGEEPAYQWQWSSNGTTWKNCTSGGYYTDNFSFTMKASLDGRQYRCKVTCGGETLISDAATITLFRAVEIISQPCDVQAAVGETVVFTVEAQSNVEGEDPACQWQWSSNGTTWKNCTSGGYNKDTFSFTMKATLSGRQYRCKVTCGGETVISEVGTITLK